jgi:hypothetical protein
VAAGACCPSVWFEVAGDFVAEAEDARIDVEFRRVEVLDGEVAGVTAVAQPASFPPSTQAEAAAAVDQRWKALGY